MPTPWWQGGSPTTPVEPELLVVERFVIYADDYCVGDGVTDDAENIRLAIAAAINEKKELRFGPKTYKVNSEIRVIDPAAKLVIRGTVAKSAQTVIQAGATMRSILCLALAQLRMEDMEIDGASSTGLNRARFGMVTQTVSFSEWKNNLFTSCVQDGVHHSHMKDLVATYSGRGVNNLSGVLIGATSGARAWVGEDSLAAGSSGSGTLRLQMEDHYEKTAFTTGETITDSLGRTCVFVGYASGTVGFLPYAGRTGGAFSGVVTGATSGATGTVVSDNGLQVGITYLTGGFLSGETITAGPSSAALTATEVFGTYCINDNNVYISNQFNGNGRLYGTAAFFTGGSQSQVFGQVAVGQRVLVTGNASVTSGGNVVTLTGTTLRHWGIRRGDWIVLNTGSNARWHLVSTINSQTQLTLSRVADLTQTNVEFAIGDGDGFHEQRSGDNGIHTIMNGLCRSNCGYAFASDGLYGHTFNGVQMDFHPGYAMRFGGIGGDPVITTHVNKCYFETLGRKPFAIVGLNGITITEPLLDRAYPRPGQPSADDPWDIQSAGAGTGLMIHEGHIRQLVGLQGEMFLQAVNVGEYFGGAVFYGPQKLFIQGLNVTSATIAPSAKAVGLACTAPINVTAITPYSTYGEVVHFYNSSVDAITFVNGASLRLRGVNAVLAQYSTLCLMHIGGGVWLEVSRSI